MEVMLEDFLQTTRSPEVRWSWDGEGGRTGYQEPVLLLISAHAMSIFFSLST